MVADVAMFRLEPFQSIRAGSIPVSDFLGGKYLPTVGAFRFLQSRPLVVGGLLLTRTNGVD